MEEAETELEMVRRHVREGKAHLEQQRELVARLLARAEPVETANTLLLEFESLQRQHLAHLERLERKEITPKGRA